MVERPDSGKPVRPAFLLEPELRDSIAQWQQEMKLPGDEEKPKAKQTKTTPPPTSATRPIAYVTINNDDLARVLNKKWNAADTDGGIRSSQLSAGASFPITHGHLKGGSFSAEFAATTSTGWGKGDSLRANAHYEQTFRDKPIADGYQSPNGEIYHLAVALDKPLFTKEHSKLDLGARMDMAYASSRKPIQNMWHERTASYFRSQKNMIADQALLNLELTGAYHLTSATTDKLYLDAAALSGVAVGNGYQGAMTGLEFSMGSRSSRYFTTRTHSAQFGNTNLEHVVQGGEAKTGAWKVSAYAAVYASGKGDYRTRVALDNPLVMPFSGDVAVTVPRFGTEDKGVASLLVQGPVVINPNGGASANSTIQQIPQRNVVNVTYAPIHVDVAAPVLNYHFNPINVEAGVNAQVQVARGVALAGRVSVASNPVRYELNPAYDAAMQSAVQKINRENKAIPTLRAFTDHKTGETAYQPTSMLYSGAVLKALDRPEQVDIVSGSKYSVQGEVSVHIAIGAPKRPANERHR